jgi:hypothetical protein
MPPLLIQVLLPFSAQPSPVSVAEVTMAPASDPASGSLKAKAAIFLPLATKGKYAACCAGVPASVIAPLPRPCIANAKSAKGE